MTSWKQDKDISLKIKGITKRKTLMMIPYKDHPADDNDNSTKNLNIVKLTNTQPINRRKT